MKKENLVSLIKLSFQRKFVGKAFLSRKRFLIAAMAIALLITAMGSASAGCIGDTFGTDFGCGDTITENCTFNENLSCPTGHGLIIEADNITIDGAGFTLNGVSSGACDSFGIQRTGIYNKGYDDVVIKNLEIKNYCNGIYFKYDSDTGDRVERVTIENCTIHHNGGDTGQDNSVHGIKAIGMFNSVIKNCRIHHNVGNGTSCEAGGNGIFLKGISGYGAWNNTVTHNEIYENRKGGFFTKMMCKDTEVSYNKIWGNGQGGIILRCKKTTTHDIHHNNVSSNNGDGFFMGGPNNTLRKNIVKNNMAGFKIDPFDIVGDGDGIDMGRNDGSHNNELYENTICGNEGTDIDTYGPDSGTTGDNNTCNMCNNYHDEGETCCSYECLGEIDLVVINKSESWIDMSNKTYSITYTIKNAGHSTACESTTGICIDGSLVATVPLWVIGPSDCYTKTVGSFTMSEGEDTVKICADNENNVEEYNETNNCIENVFEYQKGCVASDGTVFGCGDIVTKSCTFNSNMNCLAAGPGLVVGASNIVIDGAGYSMTGNRGAPNGCSVSLGFGAPNEMNPAKHSGIVVGDPNVGHFENVAIKNLEINNFCTGIAIGHSAYHNTKSIMVTDCELHDNGENSAAVGYVTHGIHMVHVHDSKITKNDIYNNTGAGCGCGEGGHGIFLYGGDDFQGRDNTITCNNLYNNRRAGFWTKKRMNNCTIAYNNVTGNGQGGIVFRCANTRDNDVIYNNVSYNKGSAIYIGGRDNNVSYNTVIGNTDSTTCTDFGENPDFGVGLMNGRPSATNTRIRDNLFCNNEYADVYTPVGSVTADSINNTCDTTIDLVGFAGCSFICANPVPVYFDFDNDNYYSNTTENCSCNNIVGVGSCCNPGLFNASHAAMLNVSGICWLTAGDDCNDCNPTVGFKPDLSITAKYETWVDLVNMSYNVTYTLKNVGSADANESTTSILIDGVETATDTIGTLNVSESYTNTVGPFTMSGERDTIKVCADKDDLIDESNDNNNCLENVFGLPGMPDIVITEKLEEWVASNETYNTYNITYTIVNIGSADAYETTTSILIDEVEVVTDPVPALREGKSFTNTVGPFTMSGERDTIKVCADYGSTINESNEDNNCLENVFECSEVGCVGEDGTLFRCGNTVTKNCTLNGNMNCSAGHGLEIGADATTIDGNFYRLDGVGCMCDARSGIYNKGHNDLVIKNLEVKRFCTGIYLGGEEGYYIYRNTIKNCNIHHNGNATFPSTTHGIKMEYVFNSTIRNNSIHHTIAHVDPNPGCEDGGNGMFLYKGNHNLVTQNRFYNNTKGGLFIKMKPKCWNISHNHLWGNGQGGLILRCCLCDFNLIEHNNASDNYGSGIFIGGSNNTIRYNMVCNNKDGGPYFEDWVGGHGYGINIGRLSASYNTLISNSICENDYMDINVLNLVIGTHGNENTCDSTFNYDDEGTTGCTYACLAPSVFDTGTGTYPSISGTHDGTLIPAEDMDVNRLYTYACTGTGGHTEYVRIWDANGNVDGQGNWSGYPGDYHNVTISPAITLLQGHTYNYTIETGSYPQIVHAKSKSVTGGNITCTKFTDANGKRYTNCIPAIRLFYEEQ